MKSETRSQLVAYALAIYAALSLISMATMSIGAGVLALCLIIAWGGPVEFCRKLLSEIEAKPVLLRFGGLSLFLIAACLLSLVTAEIWPLGFGGRYEQVHFLKDAAKLWYFVWPFVLWFALKSCSERQRGFVLKVWIGIFVVLSGIGIAQYFTGWPRPQAIPDRRGLPTGHFHATLFLGHHLSVASILIFPFFALLDFKKISKKIEPLRWLGLLLGILTLFFTFSRTLWIALPIGIVVWALLRFNWRGRIALLALMVIGAGVAYQVPAIHSRLHYPEGIHEREDLWEANWLFFKERPLTGVGLRQNEDLAGYYLMQKYGTTDVFQGHAHNDVLDMLSMTGAIGTVAFLAWWVFLFWILWLAIRRKNQSPFFFGEGLFAAFVVYQINGLTQVNFWEGKVQHQLMWVIAWALLWS